MCMCVRVCAGVCVRVAYVRARVCVCLFEKSWEYREYKTKKDDSIKKKNQPLEVNEMGKISSNN